MPIIEQLPCGCYKTGIQRLLLKLCLKRKWWDLFDVVHGPVTLTTEGLI